MNSHSGVVLVVVCMCSIIAFALVNIYPNHLMNIELDEKIQTLNRKIEFQRVIVPIYKELLKRTKMQDLNGLAYPPSVTPAKPRDIEQFSILIGNIARENKMVLNMIAPDSESYLKKSKYFGINIKLSGDFFHFRRFLLRICYIAFMQEIESIRINVENQKHSYDLRLILAQE